MANSSLPDSPGLGLRLSPKELSALNAAKVQAHSTVSLAFQRKSQRWVLRAEESGGGTVAVGHYVGFTGIEPAGILLSYSSQTLDPNSGHRVVFAEALIRYEIFRYGDMFHILISNHSMGTTSGEPSERNRPAHFRRDLLLGHHGTIKKDGSISMLDRSGEEIDIPAYLRAGIAKTLAGTRCIVCAHVHLENVPSVALPVFVKPVAEVTQAPAAQGLIPQNRKPNQQRLTPKNNKQKKVKHDPPNPPLEAAS